MFLSHIKHIKDCYNSKYKQKDFIPNALINFISFKISIAVRRCRGSIILTDSSELCSGISIYQPKVSLPSSYTMQFSYVGLLCIL